MREHQALVAAALACAVALLPTGSAGAQEARPVLGREALEVQPRVLERIERSPHVEQEAAPPHQPLVTAGQVPGPPCREPRRTVIEDGRVRIDYPDGSAEILGIDCGGERITPDGRSIPLLNCPLAHVQAAGLPPPPGDLAFNSFLGEHEAGLLRQIKHLVGDSPKAVENYLALEAKRAVTVVERVDLRRRFLDNLLGL